MDKLPEVNIVKKEIDDSHYYFVNDEFYPGVTSIIDEAAPMGYGLRMFLQNNTREEAEEIKNTAGDFGSKLHDAYERLINGFELNLAEEYPTTKEKKHLLSFYDWFNTHKPTGIKSEFVVASLTYKYAGTMDALCTINGETWLIDWKTSKAIHKNHEYQVAAYKQAYEEMTGEKIDHVAILKTGSVHNTSFLF